MCHVILVVLLENEKKKKNKKHAVEQKEVKIMVAEVLQMVSVQTRSSR